MAKLNKKKLKLQLAWTNSCFRRALLETYKDKLSKEHKQLSTRRLHDFILNRIENSGTLSPSVNEAYLRQLRELSTDKIELIIEAYNQGKQYRSPLTIDVLASELLDRSTKF